MKLSKVILWLTAFSIAMGYLETTVVVYLREIYYPNGFKFPLAPIQPNIAIAELWREATTVVMLVGVSMLAGRNSLQRLMFFLYSFAIWDLFYYAFLKVLLNWPESVFTWDILFLIPVPWVGPVLAPCLVSVTLIVYALLVVYRQQSLTNVKITGREKLIFISGCLVIIESLIYDYVCNYPLSGSEAMFIDMQNYIPKYSGLPPGLPHQKFSSLSRYS
jgi:hypothetical protein